MKRIHILNTIKKILILTCIGTLLFHGLSAFTEIDYITQFIITFCLCLIATCYTIWLTFLSADKEHTYIPTTHVAQHTPPIPLDSNSPIVQSVINSKPPIDLTEDSELLISELKSLLHIIKDETNDTSSMYPDNLSQSLTSTLDTESESTQTTDNCAIVISLDDVYQPKTYLIPNVAYNSTGNHHHNSHSGKHKSSILNKALMIMKEQGLPIQTLKSPHGDHQPIEPRYKLSESEPLSKPLQFPSNLFNLN